MKKRVIWCCEDDNAILDIEVYTLNSVGFLAEGFSDGETFWRALEEAVSKERALPDLVILDIMVPKISGGELLKRIKTSSQLSQIAVIMATAKGTEFDKIQGLDGGADYYITKPFGVMELASCVKAVLRRAFGDKNERALTFEGLAIDDASHEVKVDGRLVKITLKEYELLRLFLENPERAFGREELFDKVWGQNNFSSTRTLDIHISTLREKIAPYGECIQTVRGVGYKLTRKK